MQLTRHGEHFFKGHPLTNTADPVFATLTVSDGTISAFLDAFVQKTPEVFTHDDDGNLLSDGRWTYAYDAENRLVWLQTATAAVAAGHPNIALQFWYDYLGRRVRKLDYTWSGSAWVAQDDRRFIYRGWNQVAEFWGAYSSGNFVSTYSRQVIRGMDLAGPGQRAGGIGGVLMVQEGGQSYLPAYDAMGNVHAMIKASDGSIAAAYEYDAYGRTLRESGPYAEANPFRFSTKYTDNETGLVYHDTRYYSPSLGRFINRDTIGEQGGINLYAYVNNRVPGSFDVLGMFEWYYEGPNGEMMHTMPHITDAPGLDVERDRMVAAANRQDWMSYAEGAIANQMANVTARAIATLLAAEAAGNAFLADTTKGYTAVVTLGESVTNAWNWVAAGISEIYGRNIIEASRTFAPGSVYAPNSLAAAEVGAGGGKPVFNAGDVVGVLNSTPAGRALFGRLKSEFEVRTADVYLTTLRDGKAVAARDDAGNLVPATGLAGGYQKGTTAPGVIFLNNHLGSVGTFKGTDAQFYAYVLVQEVNEYDLWKAKTPGASRQVEVINRVNAENQARAMGLPEAQAGYRTATGAPNVDAIRRDVARNPAYSGPTHGGSYIINNSTVVDWSPRP